MDKTQAQQSVKNVVAESFSLNPSAIINLFEIDVSDLGFNMGVISETEIALGKNTIFRFHNNINLSTNSLYWGGKEYIAIPIDADGFDVNVRGSPSQPRLSITVSDEGISQLSRLKDRIYEMGDIIGAKITRIRTFAKFLDTSNFVNGVPPRDFYPDSSSELSRDIYIIDRRANENKNLVQYELSPSFEYEGIKLPGRICNSDNCVFLYRGMGCLYENASRKNIEIHEDGILPQLAPPVATSFDEPINTIITGVAFTDKGQYNYSQFYSKGDYVYLEHHGLKYYFVSKFDNNSSQPPSDSWVGDDCSHKQKGCKLRWNNIGDGSLPYGGFPSINRFR